jgi:hypothetical protein
LVTENFIILILSLSLIPVRAAYRKHFIAANLLDTHPPPCEDDIERPVSVLFRSVGDPSMAKTVKKYNTGGAWHNENYGQVFTAKAVTPTGRILAVVNVEVPLMVGIDLVEALGRQALEEIEKAAKDNASRLADEMIAREVRKAARRAS